MKQAVFIQYEALFAALQKHLTTHATVPEMRLDLWVTSATHSIRSAELVDTGGRVQRSPISPVAQQTLLSRLLRLLARQGCAMLSRRLLVSLLS